MHNRIPSRRRSSLLGLVLVVMLAFVAGCGSTSDAGDGFRLSASQLSTTTTTAPPKPANLTEVVTANVPQLQVFLEKPVEPAPGEPAPAPAPAVPASFAAAAVEPIPRDGLNSAGVRLMPGGYLYDNPTFWGKPLTMVVTAKEGDWIKVSLPARPNHQEGWVRASDVIVSSHTFHGELVLSEFTLRVWNDAELIVETPVVIGTDSTPTPVGRFYIAELLEASVAGVSPGGAYGPWILATNGYSEQLDLFDDGLPVIAFHGTNNPSLLGSKASNGCIRMPNENVTKIAETIVPGTPIEIRP